MRDTDTARIPRTAPHRRSAPRPRTSYLRLRCGALEQRLDRLVPGDGRLLAAKGLQPIDGLASQTQPAAAGEKLIDRRVPDRRRHPVDRLETPRQRLDPQL